MARKQNRILPMEGTVPNRRGKGRILFWLALMIAGLLIVAYIDGGEEPLRPISEEIAVAESVK